MRNILLGLVVLLAAAGARAQTWTQPRGVGVLPNGALTLASSVNADGMIVGTGADASGRMTAFTWTEAGRIVALAEPAGAVATTATDVNAAGHVVGGVILQDASGYRSAALVWRDGVPQELPVPPGTRLATTSAIDDSGRVAGHVRGSDPQTGAAFARAVVWTATGLVDMPPLAGGRTLEVNDVHAAGFAVGTSIVEVNGESVPHAVRWTSAGVEDLGLLPGGDLSAANGVNASGVVVGHGTTRTLTNRLVRRAFVWRPGQGMKMLPPLPGGDASEALGISDGGWIAGNSVDAAGQRQAVVWAPDGTARFVGVANRGTYSRALAIADDDEGVVHIAGDTDALAENRLPNAFLVTRLPPVPMPVANAGLDVMLNCVRKLTPVVLDASRSQAAHGGTLTYTWWLGETILAQSVEPQRTVRVELPVGRHELRLVVSEDGVAGLPDWMTVTVMDTTPPVTRFVSATPRPNGFGWNNTDVVVDFAAEDVCSDVSTMRVAVNRGPEIVTRGARTAFDLRDQGALWTRARARDVVGNLELIGASKLVQIDKVAPDVTAVVSPAPDANGWWHTDVTVTFVADDALSGVHEVAPPVRLRSTPPAPVNGWATDRAGNRGTVSIAGIRIDRKPPDVTIEPPTDADALWPPDHKMSRITVTGRVEDDGGLAGPLEVEVTSSEPDDAVGNGDGTTTGDTNGFDGYTRPVRFTWTPNADGTFAIPLRLRAERAGTGNGRVYTVTVRARDLAGHVSTDVQRFIVPKSMGSQ